MTRTAPMSSAFRALYAFRCNDCEETCAVDSYACYQDGALCHADCVGARIPNYTFYPAGVAPEDRNQSVEPTYVIRGARKAQRCGECHLEHSGDCW